MKRKLLVASLISKNEISVVYLPNYSSVLDDIEFFLECDGIKFPLKKEVHFRQNLIDIDLFSENDILLGRDYKIVSSEEESVYLDLEEYIQSEEFDQLYAYDGNDLGATYLKEATSFKLWSPVSDKVSLKLEKNDNSFVVYEMKRGEKGVYHIEVEGDHLLKKYSYLVRVNGRENEINDPYEISTSLNSKYSVIIDLEAVKKIGTVSLKNKFESYLDAIIYELHIRDFTENLKTDNAGTYLGMIDKIDYLKKLGITHVQLLPVLDYGTCDDVIKEPYNWGYDPISYFALEGSLSIMPEDPLSRMIEFKTLVNELHKAGIRVIMDVVYNHIYDYTHHDFQKNVPFYYFRKYRNKMCNASGCGNDIASERKMVRKIILDSVKFLLQTYDVDGFRFDLMGLTDVDTMNQITKLAKSIKEDVMLYGEGWHMPTNLNDGQKSSYLNADKLPNIAFFNDSFRDLIKGATFNLKDKGYISGNLDYQTAVEQALLGSVLSNKFSSSSQSVNYVECHDNQTLYDKLANIYDDKEMILNRVKLANALTILSLGIPFIHMGQEIGLSKFGLDNTYNVSKVNNMDWNLVKEREEMVKYMIDLIEIRKHFIIDKCIDDKELLVKTFDMFKLPCGVLTIAIRDPKFTNGHKKVLVLINPTDKNQSIDLDEYFRLFLCSAGVYKNRDALYLKTYIAGPGTIAILTAD